MRIWSAAAILAIAACSSNVPQTPPLANAALRATNVAPDLELRPPVLRFNLKHPKDKTEKVLGYAPDGSSHTDCVTLGIADVDYEYVKGHTGYFLISPEHQGKCEVGFDHSGKKLKSKTLPVIVKD